MSTLNFEQTLCGYRCTCKPRQFIFWRYESRASTIQADHHLGKYPHGRLRKTVGPGKKRLGNEAEAVITPGKTGQVEVIADGKKIAERGGNWFTRSFGAGYPDLESVVERLEKHRESDATR